MAYRETPFCFDCEGASLVGVLTEPESAADAALVIVVGGPQYRVGSHRQFALLARSVAAAGIACMRFDYRGMGDSEGDVVAFDATGADIAAAIEALRQRVPSVRRIALWGLCDGAAACSLFASDLGVDGMILVNPWVRTEQAAAEARLRTYYGQRLRQAGFWRKLRTGNFDFAHSARSLVRMLTRTAASRLARDRAGDATLPSRVGRGISLSRGPVLVVLSEHDEVAAEFRIAAMRNDALKSAMKRDRVTCVEIADTDHTFSSARRRDAVARSTLAWLRTHFGSHAQGAAADLASEKVMPT